MPPAPLALGDPASVERCVDNLLTAAEPIDSLGGDHHQQRPLERPAPALNK